VVSAGVKSILDIPATLERLETLGVAVVGYRTSRFPAFWLSDSGCDLDWRADSPEEIADIMAAREEFGEPSALLVANPLPPGRQLDPQLLDAALAGALAAAATRGLRGKAVSPFLLEAIQQATGGVSVGDVDHVKAVIIALSAGRARWMQVAIKPGKPFTFGVAGDRAVPLFGLPGNPVSTLVGFELYVRPSLRLLAGHPTYDRPTVNAVLDCPLTRRPDGRTHLVHVALEYDDEGRLHITNATRHGSHLVSAIMGANGLAWVPDGDGLERGAVVRTLMLGDVGQATTTSGAIA
jgi:hypothetical protein